jgi:hypothetical protein
MTLTAPYFRLVTTEVDATAKVKHEVYACAKPTLVLFDTKTQEPLASYMFQAHGEDLLYRGHSRPQASKLANSVVYPRENDSDGRQRFQGIVDQDKQYVEHVLTNLVRNEHDLRILFSAKVLSLCDSRNGFVYLLM